MSSAPLSVIDTDTHLTEPPDLWTSRLPRKWADQAPHVSYDERTRSHRWRVGDRWVAPVGATSAAGDYMLPDCPPTFEDIKPACYDATARLALMDEYGIHAQVLYSNVLAFEGHAFMALRDPELKLACVRTYNDYLVEFATPAPDRFILMANLPFWDLDASVAELERCHGLGHKGVLWAATLERHGLAHHTDEFWDPLYDVAQSLGMSINFHVGVGRTEDEMAMSRAKGDLYDAAYNVKRSALGLISNASTIADLIMSGICDRFPTLNFVSVESGYGYIPYLIEALDWQWLNSGGPRSYPDRLMPSEYFRRQIYTMFWFERASLKLLDFAPDNVMFETDFPHSTSLTPGTQSSALPPNQVVAELVEEFGYDLTRRVVHENAARLYHLG
jgi:predicted TIM-barrel fold metal-dependent hydrolase